MNYQITCINKANRFDQHSAITHVGGFINSNSFSGIAGLSDLTGLGTSFRMTQDEVIARIEAGDTFFVDNYAGRVSVVIETSLFGNKYIKTEADGDSPNNLLSLPECQRGGGLLDL